MLRFWSQTESCWGSTCCSVLISSRSWEEYTWSDEFSTTWQTCFCAAVTIDKPDFHSEFDQNKKIWVVSWKWSVNQTPPELENKAAEYLVPKQLRTEFDNELRTWIDNGWMIPYPEEECGPFKGLIPLMAVLQANKQQSPSGHGLSGAQ